MGRATFAPDGDWEAWLIDRFDSDAVHGATVPVSRPRPGDVLMAPTGQHAAVIMDVVTRGEEVYVLVGEGHVPAQYVHVEHGPYAHWWPWDETAGVEGFREPLPASGLRRWTD